MNNIEAKINMEKELLRRFHINKESDFTIAEYLNHANTIELPEWVTHVAISTARMELHVVPCAWFDKVDDFVDEDPSNAVDGEYLGSFKPYYWAFLTKADIKKFLYILNS